MGCLCYNVPHYNSGSIDPWHALSVLSSLSSTETAIFINGTSHCANMLPPDKHDPPGLTQARKVLVFLIPTMYWFQGEKRFTVVNE